MPNNHTVSLVSFAPIPFTRTPVVMVDVTKYSPIPLEMDLPLLEKQEAQEHFLQIKRQSKPRQTQLQWWAAVALTAACISLAFLLDYRWTRRISQWPIELPTRRYAFSSHAHLRDFDDDATGRRWKGMVSHDWWSSEWRDEAGRRFPRGIDVFHKLHCIAAIRKEFVTLVTETDFEVRAAEPEPEPESGQDRKARLEGNRNHLQHCFDFLRQDILCAADMTLEPLGPGYVQTDGQGVEHECRDWRLLLDHMGFPDFDEI